MTKLKEMEFKRNSLGNIRNIERRFK